MSDAYLEGIINSHISILSEIYDIIISLDDIDDSTDTSRSDSDLTDVSETHTTGAIGDFKEPFKCGNNDSVFINPMASIDRQKVMDVFNMNPAMEVMESLVSLEKNDPNIIGMEINFVGLHTEVKNVSCNSHYKYEKHGLPLSHASDNSYNTKSVCENKLDLAHRKAIEYADLLSGSVPDVDSFKPNGRRDLIGVDAHAVYWVHNSQNFGLLY